MDDKPQIAPAVATLDALNKEVIAFRELKQRQIVRPDEKMEEAFLNSIRIQATYSLIINDQRGLAIKKFLEPFLQPKEAVNENHSSEAVSILPVSQK